MIRHLFLIPTGYVLALELIAQAANPLDPGVTSLIGNGVTIAVLAWYVIYDVRVRTPAQQKAFADVIEANLSAHHKEQADNRAAFLEEQRANRTAYLAEQEKMRQHYDREIGEYRQMLRESMQAMRVAVHDVKDTAQVALGQQNIRALEQDEAREKRFPRAAE